MGSLRVRFIHPGTRLETEAQLATFCPQCVQPFDPSADDAQLEVGDPVSVHCTLCGELALQWAPLPVPPEPEPEPDPEP